MKVLVDTSVWSLALRRNEKSETTAKLSELIKASAIVMMGAVRQELLSGISDEGVFNELKSKLSVFDNLRITTNDYETAADFYNTCRKKGIPGSHTDFLICAVAYNNDLLIFTADNDFTYYEQHLPICLAKF